MGGHEPEGSPPLEHRIGDRPHAPDLEEVIHDPDRVEAGVVRRPDDPGERWADLLRTAGPGERVDLETEFQATPRSCRRRWREASALAQSLREEIEGRGHEHDPDAGLAPG